MSIRTILLPVFVEVALTFVLLFWGGNARGREVGPASSPPWQSELELPVLFYVLTIFAWNTHFADLLFVLLAWVFVVLRVLHAYGHVAGNRVYRRDSLFIASAIVLAVMWGIYALRILLAL